MNSQRWIMAPALVCICLVINANAAGYSATNNTASTKVRREAQDVFNLVESRYDKLQTLQYSAERITHTTRQTINEKWLIRYRKPCQIRIECEKPQQCLIVINTNAIIEYMPSLRKAVRHKLEGMAEDKKQQLIGIVLARVAVEGLRLGNIQSMLTNAEPVFMNSAEPTRVIVEGQKPWFRIQIDVPRRLLLSTEFWNSNRDLVLQTTSSDFAETTSGFWYPQNITVTRTTTEGLMTSTTHIREMFTDLPMENSLFQFTPPKDVNLSEE